ncbi:hypothetical protein BBJ28_00006557 [Nothophytophthora sp. Chile5]|nr:hypothetical protein BBJ28_00006557 [Nothophytophthora sp. Chile5]
MWKRSRSSALLAALLLAGTRAQQQTGADVVITMPVTIDGNLKNLQLLRGESFEDAATSFARSNGLMAATDDAKVRAVIDQLSGLLKDKMLEVEATQRNDPVPSQPKEPVPSVQLAIPLTIDGYSGDLLKYEGETPEAAVERFLYASGFTMDVMREVYPQLVSLVNRKLEELQPPRRELFAFTLSLDGREIIVRHFEGGSPMDEAVETLRNIGVSDGEFMDRVAPQIANQIANEAVNRQSSDAAAQEQAQASQPAAEPVAQQQEAQASQPRELFSMPLTLNEQPAIMIHYEGSTAKETAARFLSDNGVTDDETIESLIPQLVEIVDSRMADLLHQEAQAQAQAAAAAAVEQQRLLQQEQQRQPLLMMPINLGDQKEADLLYFEGDSVERTVELFLVGVGLGESDRFNDNVVQLSALVRERLAALGQQAQQQVEAAQAAQPTQPQPLFAIPVTLSGNVYNLEYFEGQEPNYVANAFCVEKHEIVRAELGVDFDGNQLLECQNVLARSIVDILEERRQLQAQEAGAETPLQVEEEAPTDPRGVLLFTLDIDMGDGTSVQLPLYRNDNPKELAAAFCKENELDQDNVPALVEAMEAQLAEL